MRLSVKANLVFNSMPPPPLRQNGRNCGFAVEMTRRANRGKVLPPTFPLFPPRLEIPQKTRDYHIPAATTTPGSQSPQKTKPAQIAGLFTFWWRTENVSRQGRLTSGTLGGLITRPSYIPLYRLTFRKAARRFRKVCRPCDRNGCPFISVCAILGSGAV